MKKTLIINDIKEAINLQDLLDAYIVPIKDFSINYDKTFTLEDVKTLKQTNKEIFVSVNKNIHNNELENLKTLLKEIEKLQINGIIFYDIAVPSLKTKLNIKTPLVWHQEHLTTNYGTINYWYEKGCKYAYLSSELTKNEIEEIKENTKAKLFVNVFGYIPMFTSKRHLVNNYLDYFNLKDKNQNKSIHKEGKNYPIIDKKQGTTVFTDYILNIESENINADYLVYNSFQIPNETLKEILKNNKYPKNTGFLYQETIYKVK